MSRWLARLLGKRVTGGDLTLGVSAVSYRVGRLMVAALPLQVYGAVFPMSESFVSLLGGTTTAPKLLTRVEVANIDGSSANTFYMAMMTVNDGSPTTDHALIGWRMAVAANTVWSWTGEIPLIGRYLYWKTGGATKMNLYLEWEDLTA